jgi:hypothetical protein
MYRYRRRPWTAEEDAQLAVLINERNPPHRVATILKRNAPDVRKRAADLGLTFSSRPSTHKRSSRSVSPIP